MVDAPAYIRMDERAPHGPGDGYENSDESIGQTEHGDGREPADADADHIEGMGARIGEPTHLFRAVMNGVKAPKEEVFVGPAPPTTWKASRRAPTCG